MSLPEKPITRAEQYLASIAGQETTLPAQPETRLEQYLDYIAKNGGGLPDVTGATNGSALRYLDSAVVWSPPMAVIDLQTSYPEVNTLFATALTNWLSNASNNMGQDVFGNASESGKTSYIHDLLQTVGSFFADGNPVMLKITANNRSVPLSVSAGENISLSISLPAAILNGAFVQLSGLIFGKTVLLYGKLVSLD